MLIYCMLVSLRVRASLRMLGMLGVDLCWLICGSGPRSDQARVDLLQWTQAVAYACLPCAPAPSPCFPPHREARPALEARPDLEASTRRTGAMTDDAATAKGLKCIDCKIDIGEGEGTRWKTTLVSGDVAEYARCDPCATFQSRLKRITNKSAEAKQKWGSMDAEGRKKWREEHKNDLPDDLATALTNIVVEVAVKLRICAYFVRVVA